MKRSTNLLISILLVILFGTSAFSREFVTIGTGGITGVYYPTGGAIQRIVNKKSAQYNIKVTVESTDGSVHNINAVLNNELEFGLAQSDRQYQAFRGLAEWSKDGAQKDLRSIFSIHPETVTLIASAKTGIQSVTDLKSKRVNIGNMGSGQLQNSKDVLSFSDIDLDSLEIKQVKPVEAPILLQEDLIDAFFYTVGHPNGNIKEATSGRVRMKIIPIKGKGILELLEKYPYYTKTIIPIRFYPNIDNDRDVESIGVKATLVTSEKIDQDIVYAVAKEVFDNLAEFKALHPAYYDLTKENMLKGLSAPIHDGALKYYKEVGLLKYIDPRLIKR